MAQRDRTGAILREHLHGLVGAESQLHALVQRLLRLPELAAHGDVRSLLERLEPRLHAHLAALRRDLERLGGGAAPLRASLGRALGVLAAAADRWRRQEAATRDLRDLYALLSWSIASYGILATAGEVLGEPQTAELAQAHVDDLAAALEDLTVVLPDVVQRELGGEPQAAAAV